MKGRLAPSKLAKRPLADINLLKHSGFPGYRRLPAKICDQESAVQVGTYTTFSEVLQH